MRWIGYVRVSTDEQARSGLGLEAQEEAIRSTLGGGVLVDVIADEGETGKHLDRPGLQAALQRLAAGEADGLVVAKLDRVSRSVGDFATLMAWTVRSGVQFRALDLGVDTTTPGGKLVANVLMAVAEWEREVIAERTRTALGARVARGLPATNASVASSSPDIAARIVELRDSGMTVRAIAEQLNTEGVPTVRGGLWQPSTVHRVATGYERRKSRPRPVKLPEVQGRRRR